MRSLLDMETIQIEITNQCHYRCSNCTRLVGHHPQPYFMETDQFMGAVNSLSGYPKMVGVMGGEPLLHPAFGEFCEYLHSKIPPERCGLWTAFPPGKEHHREVIAKTFGNIFLNDHSRDDIYHCPVLVSSDEVCTGSPVQWYLIDKCWVQSCWSASINSKGAFFCEVAAALALLFDINVGWKVEPNWWERVPMHYIDQIKALCGLCGCAMPLVKRASVEGIDDVSQGIYERLKETSPKIKAGKYVIHDLLVRLDPKPMATYKDVEYRAGIATRYGMFLMPNEKGYQTPFLKKKWNGDGGENGVNRRGEVYGEARPDSSVHVHLSEVSV